MPVDALVPVPLSVPGLPAHFIGAGDKVTGLPPLTKRNASFWF